MALMDVVAARSANLLFPRRRSAGAFNVPGSSLVAQLRALWPHFRAAGQATGISPYVLAGVAIGESNLNPRARNSRTGAAGIMQVMPEHFPKLGWTGDMWADPGRNIRAGAQLLADQVRTRGGIERGLAGYGGFTTWLRDPQLSSVDPAKRASKDASWYIDEALGRAWVLQVANEAGSLGLD